MNRIVMTNNDCLAEELLENAEPNSFLPLQLFWFLMVDVQLGTKQNNVRIKHIGHVGRSCHVNNKFKAQLRQRLVILNRRANYPKAFMYQ